MNAAEATTPKLVSAVRILRRSGLSLNQVDSLIAISLADDIGPTSLASRLNVCSAAVTQILDVLEGRRYISRRYAAGTGDRRKTVLGLTEAGRQFLESLESLMEAAER